MVPLPLPDKKHNVLATKCLLQSGSTLEQAGIAKRYTQCCSRKKPQNGHYSTPQYHYTTAPAHPVITMGYKHEINTCIHHMEHTSHGAYITHIS